MILEILMFSSVCLLFVLGVATLGMVAAENPFAATIPGLFFIVILFLVLKYGNADPYEEFTFKEYLVQTTIGNIDFIETDGDFVNLNTEFGRDFEEGDIIYKKIFHKVTYSGIIYPEHSKLMLEKEVD